MTRAIIFLIGIYQRVLSPDHSWVSCFFPNGYCRFYPTCSRYAQAAVKKYGIVRGAARAARRLLSCHPWHAGGVDGL
ncbi:membrane protein insertion efficiency factor YidD [Candidatus Uhrbacteria bacterium]|nr:membrane protein insertion efficiency factor YidD [Candidatus Uhrbacteria bacterium]